MYLHLCIYASMHLCIYVSMYLCIYVSMYLCIYVSMYLCTYVYMYLCIYVSMYLPGIKTQTPASCTTLHRCKLEMNSLLTTTTTYLAGRRSFGEVFERSNALQRIQAFCCLRLLRGFKA